MLEYSNTLLVSALVVSLLCPPLATGILCGCTPDVLLNLILTFLGWIPGTVHVIYLAFVVYDRKLKAKEGTKPLRDAPMVFSKRIQDIGSKQEGKTKADPNKVATVPDAAKQKEKTKADSNMDSNVEPATVPDAERPNLLERSQSEPEPVREGVTA
ncbi:hypothetical protein QBC38DRAFT_206313 [Podospora fimiseda]|uniref:Plasma membrane proteolipid 3 n=1 Tax=Podospora fimiseda TaxID=252190 RepID=A0AAN7BPJ5_9PEZI|nr:hypothetical protein QBC38DRAFT_206313 [Podospora fimiseda]